MMKSYFKNKIKMKMKNEMSKMKKSLLKRKSYMEVYLQQTDFIGHK